MGLGVGDPVLPSLQPGQHLVVLGEADQGLWGRRQGLELRDTLLILRPGPRSSFGFLFRKPLAEPTVADQMQVTRTGALNVDGCRIPSAGEHMRPTITGRTGGMVASDPRQGPSLGMFSSTATFSPTNHPEGRWPSNVVLVHGPRCRREGIRKVRGAGFETSRPERRTGNCYGKHRDTPFTSRTDPQGLETIQAWSCEPGCPAKILDELTGELTSGAKEIASRSRDSVKDWRYKEGTTCFADTGGASRFYPGFANMDELWSWIARLMGPAPV